MSGHRVDVCIGCLEAITQILASKYSFEMNFSGLNYKVYQYK